MSRIDQQALKTELAKRGFESMSIKRELPGGRIEIEANKLHPVPVEAGESIDITRRGKKVARLTAVDMPRKRIDLAMLRALTDGMRPQAQGAAELVRAMRDGDRY